MMATSYADFMNLSQEIANKWKSHQQIINTAIWLISPQGSEAEETLRVQQERLMACLLMTPFSSDFGRKIGQMLVEQLAISPEKLTRWQQMLTEQLLTDLSGAEVSWLAPRMTALWAEVSAGYALAQQAQHKREVSDLKEKISTERSVLKHQADEGEARFRALFEANYTPVVLSYNNRVLSVNTAVTLMLGYSAEELLGQDIGSLVETIVPTADQPYVLAQLEETQTSSYQTPCWHKNGSIMMVDISTRKIIYEGKTMRLTVLNPQTDASQPLITQAEANLTPRQLDVLTLLARGFTDQEIASKLNISIHTVKRHNRNIFEKLRVTNRVGAVAWALKALPM